MESLKTAQQLFKEIVISDFVPRIEKMIQKEESHLEMLKSKSNEILIIESQDRLIHYLERLKEYKEYAATI